jgi:hypothetical protein
MCYTTDIVFDVLAALALVQTWGTGLKGGRVIQAY